MDLVRVIRRDRDPLVTVLANSRLGLVGVPVLVRFRVEGPGDVGGWGVLPENPLPKVLQRVVWVLRVVVIGAEEVVPLPGVDPAEEAFHAFEQGGRVAAKIDRGRRPESLRPHGVKFHPESFVALGVILQKCQNVLAVLAMQLLVHERGTQVGDVVAVVAVGAVAELSEELAKLVRGGVNGVAGSCVLASVGGGVKGEVRAAISVGVDIFLDFLIDVEAEEVHEGKPHLSPHPHGGDDGLRCEPTLRDVALVLLRVEDGATVNAKMIHLLVGAEDAPVSHHRSLAHVVAQAGHVSLARIVQVISCVARTTTLAVAGTGGGALVAAAVAATGAPSRPGGVAELEE